MSQAKLREACEVAWDFMGRHGPWSSNHAYRLLGEALAAEPDTCKTCESCGEEGCQDMAKYTPYGQECILDIHDSCLFDRKTIEVFCVELCKLLDMTREDLFFWDYERDPDEYEKAPPHLKGTSAVQFIQTSNITIHALDELKRLYLNVFSCKPFDASAVRDFVCKFTGGVVVKFTVLTRI